MALSISDRLFFISKGLVHLNQPLVVFIGKSAELLFLTAAFGCLLLICLNLLVGCGAAISTFADFTLSSAGVGAGLVARHGFFLAALLLLRSLCV